MYFISPFSFREFSSTLLLCQEDLIYSYFEWFLLLSQPPCSVLSPNRVSQGPRHPSGPAFSDGGHSAHRPCYSAYLEAPHYHSWSEGICKIWGRASQSKMGHGKRLGWFGLGIFLSHWFGSLNGQSRYLGQPDSASTVVFRLASLMEIGR